MKHQAKKSKGTASGLPAPDGSARAKNTLDFETAQSPALIDRVPVLVVVLDLEGRILLFNRVCQELTGFDKSEVEGQLFWDVLLVPEEIEAVKRVFYSLRDGLVPSTFENYWKCKNGDRLLTSWHNATACGPDGTARWIISTGVDISHEARLMLASIAESSDDAIIGKSLEGIITAWNSGAERLYGYKQEEVLGRPISILAPPELPDEIPQILRKIAAGERVEHYETVRVKKDGSRIDISLTVSPVKNRAGTIIGASAIGRDITARKRRDKRLRELGAMLDKAQDAIMVRDFNGRVTYWNQRAERLYGWTAEEALGKDVRELIYDTDTVVEFDKAMGEVLAGGEWTGEMRQVTKHKNQIAAECRWTLVRDDGGKPRSLLAINTDITEKKKMEAQFLRAQRMESVGTLAGGIAHDLNNVLSPVLMALQLLRTKLRDDEGQALLSVLQTNVKRGSDMVRQVLSFARGIEGERIRIQPSHLLKELAKVMRETLPKNIAVRIDIGDGLWAVSADATQFYQVLMNLCVNARDAMPDGGTLSIRAENATLDELYSSTHIEATPGNFVLVTISDTGVGIPAEIIDKIYEPFFTTKEFGKGTGLGLSTAIGIIKSHGGFINVYSEVGKGTEFRIYLPAVGPGTTEASQVDTRELPVGHGETILVVDDEAAIREIARATLDAFGYKVLTAGDGTEALALYAQDKDKIKVVVMDMVMPFLDGPATIRALQRLDPRVRIVATSGLPAEAKGLDAFRANVRSFLHKPYTAEKLLITLAEAVQ
jgi:PAS domain S-box-containing protein